MTVTLSYYRIVLFCIINRDKKADPNIGHIFGSALFIMHMFIVLILPAYKWLPPFAADV